MRERRNKNFAVGLLLFLLLLTGGYALLATNLNITGTATGTGDFKIEFNSYTVSDEAKATATLDADRTSMTIDANLSFPGDTVTIDFTIKNTGSLAATVSDLTINNNGSTDFNIAINGLDAIEGTTLGVGQSTNGSIVVTWNASSTTATPEGVTFDVTINYLQATV